MAARSRSANYSIQGFLYQLNLTLQAILDSQENASITVEGLIEDIEIIQNGVTTAVQCKYHEAQNKFNLSSLYKPILQMMCHFKKNSSASVKYRLFAHFPNQSGSSVITAIQLAEILKSKNKDFQKYIHELIGFSNFAGFLARFELYFGPSIDELIADIQNKLVKNGMPEGEIETLCYPNAIHLIAMQSIKSAEKDRKTTKKDLVRSLKKLRTTIVSRWTLALKSKRQILETRRKQLKPNLDKNVRNRVFVLAEEKLDDFDNQIVLFISEYCSKYHCKLLHTKTPIFCLDTDAHKFDEIQYRLYLKGLIPNDGRIGNHFDETFFFREPMYQKEGTVHKKEFSVRLKCGKLETLPSSHKPDDFDLTQKK